MSTRLDGSRPGARPAAVAEWHALELPAVFRAVGAGDGGLTSAEADARLGRFGPNELPRPSEPAWWHILLRQFLSPLIYLLGFATLVSLLVGDLGDAAFIGAVMAMNAAVGGYQEWRAERGARALRQLLRVRASVVRDGETREIDAEAVVPGDVAWLESGNRVPADLRLLTAHGLDVDESPLTGESLPVLKDPAWHGEGPAPSGDRRNMVYAGTTIVRGRGKGIVVATGTATVVGQLALDVGSTGAAQPPLIVRMERFNRAVAVAVVAAAVVIALIGVLVHRHPLIEMLFFAIALAVAAIPEGLPAALTIVLAVATRRMARRGVIVRQLAAVEGLGSCTLIASDKTGTLTCNELTVREVFLPEGTLVAVTGEGYRPTGQVLIRGQTVALKSDAGLDAVARAAVLCNEGDLHARNGEWVWRGDPTDVALLSFARKLGWEREAALDRNPQVNQIPFEPEHRFAATYHRVGGDVRVFVKGAPERVLAMCDGTAGRLTPSGLQEIAEGMARSGRRVLALAEGPVPADLDPATGPPGPSGLAFLGFVGMIDPPRPGAREAVTACRTAGITVCMVTGDHPVTALAIARDLGLAEHASEVVSGQELDEKSPAEVQQIVRQGRVFARVAPRQKLEIVGAARRLGHFVAVTGDGVNDAPALRHANIGVAMGRSGTDVAREAAQLVISDDNFATIIAGVEEGRVAYDNVRKVIYLLVPGGAAEVIALGLAVAAGLPLPLLPVQLLWLNVVTNGLQGVALAFEPGEGDVLRRPPRSPREPIFDRLMVRQTALAALVMGGAAFGAFRWMLGAGWSEASARNALLLLMVLFLNVHIGNSRSETKSAFRLSPLRVPLLLGTALAALLLHVLAMYLPVARQVLQTEPVSLGTWAALVAVSTTVLIAPEIHKWLGNSRHTTDGAAKPDTSRQMEK
ncbi:MAG TPA: HAD-IC family P-type ATPase [Gemmataceae bacterium]|jgi:magnesium-transporting ATPase (P-type)